MSWLLAAVSLAAILSSVASDTDICKAVSAAYLSKGGTDVLHVQYQPSAGHLRECVQRRPTCCSRPMEDWLQRKASKELYEMIFQQLVPRSTALSSLVSSLQSLFLHMLNASHQDLDMNLKSIYGYSYIENKQPFTLFFDQLRTYMTGGSDTIADVTRTLFENIAARVYVLIMTNYDIGEQYLACVKQQLTTLRPLGQVPDRVGQELTRAFVTARRFLLGLAALKEAIDSAPIIKLSDQCQRSRLRAHYCAWCDGLVAMQPCYGLCARVAADCLAPLDPLVEPFDLLVVELTRLADKVEGPNNLHQVLYQLGLRISGGIMDMQERKEHFQSQVAKACGQPRLKAGGPGTSAGRSALPAPQAHVAAPSANGQKRRRRSSELFGWEYRGKDEPLAKGDQQERLSQLVRVAKQELPVVRNLFNWDRMARANCQPDPGPPSRCWNGTDPAPYRQAQTTGAATVAFPIDTKIAERASNLRAAHRLVGELPRSDNFVEFRENRLDEKLGHLLIPRAAGGSGGGGGPAVITDALPTRSGSALPTGSGSGSAPPPQRPQDPQPGAGVRRFKPQLVLSTLPPRVPLVTTQPTGQPLLPKQPDPDGNAPTGGSGDSSPPPLSAQPPTPVAPVVVSTSTRQTTPPSPSTVPPSTAPPPSQQTQPPPRPPIDSEGSGTDRPPTERPPPAVPPTPGSSGPVTPGPGQGPEVPPDVGPSGVGEPTEAPPQPPRPSRRPQPSSQPPGPDEPSGPSGDSQPPLPPWTQPPPPPSGPATGWPPLPPPQQPELPGTPPQPPQQPDPNADLWLPKEPNEQGGAEKSQGEGSIHSPMKMTEAKRSCPPGSLTCPACRPTASAAAAALLLLAGLLMHALLQP